MKNDINVLATLDLSSEAQARIRGTSERVKLTVIPTNNPNEINDKRWSETEVLFTQGVLPEMGKAPNLKWVQFRSAGIDSFLDDPVVSNKKITATTMSGVITHQIAEYILMAMLALGQKLPELLRYQQVQKWPEGDEKRQNLLPVELRHSTVGILGYGSIGRQVARLLQPFGATVLAIKKNVMKPEDTGYFNEGMGDPHGDFFDRLYPIEALHSLLEKSDFVIVTLPLTESTHHIMDAKALEAMKPSAFLVNVGRGELIDQSALVQALENKQIAGAVLDVVSPEPLPEDSTLWHLDNVIITPHVSGLSSYLDEDTLSLFIENLNRYMAELPLYNQVNPEEGY